MADAGRVIAGSARGLRLQAPRGDTRALGDRVKQTLFAILEPRLRGARVLDLFAGSGAAGIEAASRGAAMVTFVEHDAGAVAAIRANLARTRLDGPERQVVRADVTAWLEGEGRTRGPFDVVIVDPPYASPGLLTDALAKLADRRWQLLGPAAVVVAKHASRDQPPDEVGLLASVDVRRFGDTALTFYEHVAERRDQA